MSEVTKVALIGYGPWGRNYHRTIESLRDVHLHSICRIHPESTPAGIRKQVLVTSDLLEALDGADWAVVATPPSSHKEVACACLKIGVPVMLEKPVALTLSDSDEIFAAAKESGLFVLVNNVHLFSPSFETLLSMTKSWNSIEIESEGGGPGPIRDYSPLFDWGPHDLSMALAMLGGSPSSCSLRVIPSDTGEVFEVLISSVSGSAKIMIGNGFSIKKRRFEVRCGTRSAVYDDMSSGAKLVVDGRPVKGPDEAPLRRAILSFHRYVTTGKTDWRFSSGLNKDIMAMLVDMADSVV